jgi:hypothetical protein
MMFPGPFVRPRTNCTLFGEQNGFRFEPGGGVCTCTGGKIMHDRPNVALGIKREIAMNRRGLLTIAVKAPAVLGMALAAAIAAPTARERDQCYGSCYAKCAAQHACQRPDAGPNCFAHFNQCKAVCRSNCPR